MPRCCSPSCTLRAAWSPRYVPVSPAVRVVAPPRVPGVQRNRARREAMQAACWRAGRDVGGPARGLRRGTHRLGAARAGMQGGQHPDAHVDGFVLNSIFVHLERADGRVQTHRRMMQFDDHPHLDPSVAPEQVQSCSWALAHGACRRR